MLERQVVPRQVALVPQRRLLGLCARGVAALGQHGPPAATVREQLAAAWRDMRVGHLLSMLQFGTLPTDLTESNMRLFASEVMPALRAESSAATMADAAGALRGAAA